MFRYQRIKQAKSYLANSLAYDLEISSDASKLIYCQDNSILFFSIDSKRNLTYLSFILASANGQKIFYLHLDKQSTFILFKSSFLEIWKTIDYVNWNLYQLEEQPIPTSVNIYCNQEQNIFVYGHQDKLMIFQIQQDQQTWKCVNQIQIQYQINSLSINKSNNSIIIGTMDNQIIIIQLILNQWKLLKKFNSSLTNRVMNVSFIALNCFFAQSQQLYFQQNNEIIKLLIYKCNQWNFKLLRKIAITFPQSQNNQYGSEDIKNMKYIEERSIILLQLGQIIYFIKLLRNDSFQIIKQFKLEGTGVFSNDLSLMIRKNGYHNHLEVFEQIQYNI